MVGDRNSTSGDMNHVLRCFLFINGQGKHMPIHVYFVACNVYIGIVVVDYLEYYLTMNTNCNGYSSYLGSKVLMVTAAQK